MNDQNNTAQKSDSLTPNQEQIKDALNTPHVPYVGEKELKEQMGIDTIAGSTENTSAQRKEHVTSQPDTLRQEQHRGKWYKAVLVVTVVMLFSIIVGTVVFLVYKMQTGTNVQTPVEEVTPEETPIIVTPEEPKPTENMYLDRELEFTISYPLDVTLTPPDTKDTGLVTYLLTYNGQNQSTPITNEASIADGYLLKLNVQPRVLNQDLGAIALEKRNLMLLQCPDTATISDITDTQVSQVNSKTFGVENCDKNYRFFFTLRNNGLFEFTQAYSGDLGVRQVYKAELENIMAEFRFINTLLPTPVETWNTFEERGAYFRFKYPSEMDTTCCSLNGPISSSSKKALVIADPKTVKGFGGNQFNGLAVYYENAQDMTLEQYAEKQKQLLIENYRVIVGREPNPITERLTVAGRDALRLRGYAWWGDVIMFETHEDRGNHTIVTISTTETTPESFDDLLNRILETIEIL